MKKEKFYEAMEGFNEEMQFKEVHKTWFKCFSTALKSFEKSFSDEAIKSLFYYFDMENWTALHQDNTEYKGKSQHEMFKEFIGECGYISDRMSYDRLFRAHWLFKQAFYKEMNAVKYPELYN